MKPIKPDLALWKSVQAQHRNTIVAQRKTGAQMREYLLDRYPATVFADPRMDEVVLGNLAQDPYLSAQTPEVAAYRIENTGAAAALYQNRDADYADTPIFVGIELTSGYVFCQGSDKLSDELFLYQGLSEAQLDNAYLVWRYVTLSQA